MVNKGMIQVSSMIKWLASLYASDNVVVAPILTGKVKV